MKKATHLIIMGMMGITQVVHSASPSMSSNRNLKNRGTVMPGQVPGSGLFYPGMPVIVNGERFDFTNADIGELMSNAMVTHFQRQKEDKDFFVSSIKHLEMEFNRVYRDIILGKFQKLANTTLGGDFPQVIDYANAVIDYKTSKAELENLITGIETMSKGALPSAKVMVSEKRETEVAGYLSVSFTQIARYYREVMNTRLEAELSKMTFRLKDKAGIPIEGKGLAVDLSQANILTEAERVALQKEMERLRMSLVTLYDRQDKYTIELQGQFLDFIDMYGKMERYRWRSSGKPKRDIKSDLEARKEAYEELYTTFFSRSYLRVKYGLPIGVVGINYTKKPLGIEQFTNHPEEYVKFSKIPIRSQRQIRKIRENYRNVLEVVIDQATPAYQRLSLFDGNFSIFGAANSLFTFFRGLRAMQESAAMIHRLLAADVHEELLIMSSGGRQKIVDYFNGRYYGTDEMKKSTTQLRCAFDPNSKTCMSRTFQEVKDAKGWGQETLLTLYRQIELEMKIGVADNLRRSDAIEKQLEELTHLASSEWKKEVDDVLDKLGPKS